MGDDGEKFGAWPTTWEHCWGDGRWVDRFFDALEANADWLSTTTPSAWLDANPPIGRVSVPTGSYAEMGEWALPPDESLRFAEVLHRARAEGRPEARWLRGASWRNFQVKYREVNDLHKQMLRVSAMVDTMPAGRDRDRATGHLYRSQSNDCYWHGLFGGIYISHMRLATHEHLIAAEDLADAACGTLTASAAIDLDLDGVDEVRLAAPGQVVTVDPYRGAGIGDWDIRAVRHALCAVMRRRPEAYHEVLRDLSHAGHASPTSAPPADGPASIHDRFRVKEPGLVDRLVYDPYERRSALVRALAPDAMAADWAAARATELGDAVDGAFTVIERGIGHLTTGFEARIADAAVAVTRTVRLGGDRRTPTLDVEIALAHRDGPSIDIRLGLEWSITMLGGGGNPAAWWEVDGVRVRHDSAGEAAGITAIAQGNDDIGISVETTLGEPTDAWWAPIETISNSEDGFERVYQGSGLLLSWPVRLGRGERVERTVRHRVTTGRDRMYEDR
jgi:alpha-amylase